MIIKKFDKNNVTNVNNVIALNVLYLKKEKVYSAYVSKHNLNRENLVFFLMIPRNENN